MMPTFKKDTLLGGVTHLAQGNNLNFLSFVKNASIMKMTQHDSLFIFFYELMLFMMSVVFVYLASLFLLRKVTIIFHRVLISLQIFTKDIVGLKCVN